MSATPKYSRAQLSAARKRRLEADRRRRTQEEAQHRRQIERQAREQRCAGDRGEGLTPATQALADLDAWYQALCQDPTLQRWVAREVAALERLPRAAAAAVRAGDHDLPQRLLAQARTEEQRIVALAETAQLKADCRDGIAQDMAAVLADMGFILAPTRAEHPDQPATALILQAEKPSGQALFISVPLEGEIWYELHGYPFIDQTTPGGETKTTCATALALLDAMRARLAATHAVIVDPIQWAGNTAAPNAATTDVAPSIQPVTNVTPTGKRR
ncbi:MAG: hypothetical protein HQL66_11095 [Magnetococcales bacterium]|nr:hypothetical protein [Magnetococcales bacterium]